MCGHGWFCIKAWVRLFKIVRAHFNSDHRVCPSGAAVRPEQPNPQESAQTILAVLVDERYVWQAVGGIAHHEASLLVDMVSSLDSPLQFGSRNTISILPVSEIAPSI
jgi:hypothetical protein